MTKPQTDSERDGVGHAASQATEPRRWRGRVFIATSLDGFIARSDASLEWLTDPPPTIEHERIASDRQAIDWDSFLPSIDHIVMGRGTYETACSFDRWPYPRQRVVVLSTTLDVSADPRTTVVRSLSAAVGLLAEEEARSVYIDGGRTIRSFLEADLVDEMTISTAPIVLGCGIPLFDSLSREVRLRLRAAHASAGGMTHATYEVVRTKP